MKIPTIVEIPHTANLHFNLSPPFIYRSFTNILYHKKVVYIKFTFYVCCALLKRRTNGGGGRKRRAGATHTHTPIIDGLKHIYFFYCLLSLFVV